MALSAPLLPVEQRLLTPFNQRGLEVLRQGVLAVICTAGDVEVRIRAVLLTAHQNDFRPVFADVLYVPPSILREQIIKPRSLFLIHAQIAPLQEALDQAQRELNTLGLSNGYLELIASRVRSRSPQQVVNAACAILLFGAMFAPGTV
jgi:hypothetical protein